MSYDFLSSDVKEELIRSNAKDEVVDDAIVNATKTKLNQVLHFINMELALVKHLRDNCTLNKVNSLKEELEKLIK